MRAYGVVRMFPSPQVQEVVEEAEAAGVVDDRDHLLDELSHATEMSLMYQDEWTVEEGATEVKKAFEICGASSYADEAYEAFLEDGDHSVERR